MEEAFCGDELLFESDRRTMQGSRSSGLRGGLETPEEDRRRESSVTVLETLGEE